jgi:hypothetical protein
MSKLVPQSGGQTVNLNPASTTESQFEIPAKCITFAKSVLHVDVTVPKGAAGEYTRVFKYGLTPIDRISLLTRSGTYLCDLLNVGLYTRALNPYVTKMKDYLEHDTGKCDFNTNGAIESGQQNHRCNERWLTPGSQGNKLERINVHLNTNAATGYLVDNDSVVNHTESEYVADPKGADFDMAWRLDIPMSAFHHSILAVNRDLYFGGEVLICRIQFAPANKLGFVSTSATNFVTGHAPVSSAARIDNLSMFLAVESNPLICSSLIQKSQSGFQMIVPYVHAFKNSTAASTSSNIQQRVNIGHGRSLLRVYHVVNHNDESNRTAYDINITYEEKIINFYSALDNERLQEITVDPSKNEDYMFLQESLKGSTIQNSRMYKYNRVWIDDWSGLRTSDYKESDTVANGLDLSKERLWSIHQTTENADYNQYSFFVVQKLLSIGGQIVLN